MRLGIYGGSFDPLHCGHLLLAECARVEMNLDRVEFVPLGVPPHRKNVKTDGELRYQMVLRAIKPYPEFTVSRAEIDSPEVSYTADTLARYRQEYPDDELFFIVSSETFNDMPNWRRPGEICGLASLIIARRAGYPPPDFDALLPFTTADRVDEFRRNVIETPLFEASSTMVRQRIAEGRGARFLVPDPVLDFIYEKGLYSASNKR